MGNLEYNSTTKDCHEIGVVIEAVADTQEKADTICAFARSSMLHFGYEGRKATAGNLAFPYSPSDFHAGEVYNFSIYHLMEVNNPADIFRIDYEINKMICEGWKVISITPISKRLYDSNPTDYVIVIYEKEE